MRALLKTIVAMAALAAPLYANALPITWNYSGVCTAGDCGVVPSITGTLIGDPGLLGNPGELSEFVLFGELTSYSFSVGGYDFNGTRGEGSYTLDGAGNIVGGSMIFANLFALEFLDVGNATWSIVDANCSFFKGCTSVVADGRGSYTRATAVAEPTTLSLLGLGLLAFGLVWRRRRV